MCQREVRFPGKTLAVNKYSIMQLTQQMMRPSPRERPTANACLQPAWLMEDKRDRSSISGTAVALPPMRVLYYIFYCRWAMLHPSVHGAMFPEDRNPEIKTNDRTANGTMFSRSNDCATPPPFTRGGTLYFTRRLVATIERELSGGRSLERRTGLDNLGPNVDAGPDLAASVEPA